MTHKGFPGGHITLAGANSAASLSSRPIRILLADEVDRYPASAGTEGDPLTLGTKRTATFWNRKIVEVSSPTVAGSSRIDRSYEQSDRRRFWIPCPHCGEAQVLAWERVRWTGGDPATARYHCAGCGAGWTDAQRWAAVKRGEWRAEMPFKGVAGFHLSELYSPWRRLEQTVADFLAASGKAETMKAWKNTSLAETWQEEGEAPDWERLLERREAFPMAQVPAGAWILTAGVDAQKDRLEVYVWGWAPGLESWLVDFRVLDGSPADDAPWDELAGIMSHDFPCADGSTMRISRAGCDTGGLDTAAVYGQIRRLADPRVVALKGVEGWNRASPVHGPTLVDINLAGRKIKRGLRLYTVSVSTFKADLYRRLWLGRGEAEAFPRGWVHIPDGIGAESIQQLVAEQLVTSKDRRGFARQEWRKLRDRNEALDCAVYARAALALAGADRYGEGFWTPEMLGREPVGDAAEEADEAEEAAPAMARAAPGRRVVRSSYLSRIGR